MLCLSQSDWKETFVSHWGWGRVRGGDVQKVLVRDDCYSRASYFKFSHTKYPQFMTQKSFNIFRTPSQLRKWGNFSNRAGGSLATFCMGSLWAERARLHDIVRVLTFHDFADIKLEFEIFASQRSPKTPEGGDKKEEANLVLWNIWHKLNSSSFADQTLSF